MEYKNFASYLSFFEFIQDEFGKPVFNVANYEEEFQSLKSVINIDTIVKLLETKPRIFDIFEQVLQSSRFTNAQYIHFLFDISILNHFDINNILDYSEKSILKFENGKLNDLFNRLLTKNSISNEALDQIYSIKKTIPVYVDNCIKKKDFLYIHLVNSIGSRYRISKYLVENLKIDDLSNAIEFKKYLQIKRIPKDTKGIHGKFGTIKISNIFKEHKIENISTELLYKTINIGKPNLPNIYKDKLCYANEKCIDGIVKRKNKKLKKFDFILFYNCLPVIAIETNFYSTNGTKIQINVGEYTDLIEDINSFNKSTINKLNFMWITDGNFWLSTDGQVLFENLKMNYFKGEFELLNYNYLKLCMNKIHEQFTK